MVYCPFLLKKNKKTGITVIELLIVITSLGILAVIAASLINPQIQLGKGRDARRKADLQKLRNPLEDFHNDHECYPSTLTELLPYYLKEIPKDPETKQEYLYLENNCDQYWIYAKLENSKDQAIASSGCQDGCGPDDRYNYGIASGNTRPIDGPTATPVVGGTATPTPTPTTAPSGQYWGCVSGVCTPKAALSCQPLYDVSNCYGQCAFGNECE